MDTLLQDLKTRYFSLLDGRTTVQEFEAWVYQTPQLEDLLGLDYYLSLLELDYSAASAVDEISMLLNRFFDSTCDSEWESIKLKNRLVSSLRLTPFDLLYDLEDDGYIFLNEILDRKHLNALGLHGIPPKENDYLFFSGIRRMAH